MAGVLVGRQIKIAFWRLREHHPQGDDQARTEWLYEVADDRRLGRRGTARGENRLRGKFQDCRAR